MHEIHSYIWEDSAVNKNLGIETESYIRLVNSLQKDNDNIRSTMMPTILRGLIQNKKYDSSVGIFEIGHIVTGIKDNLAIEEKSLCMGWIFDQNLLADKLLNAKNTIQSDSLDIISLFKNESSVEQIKKIYEDVDIGITQNGEYYNFKITTSVNLITTGLNRILGDPYKIVVERVIPYA
jgi:phenylalanyl-tRNA synthetase beta subunit